MPADADPHTLSAKARKLYAEQLAKGLAGLVNAVSEAARGLLDKPADHVTAQVRRDVMLDMQKGAARWHQALMTLLRNALMHGVSASRPEDLPTTGRRDALSLVDNVTIEREILGSRLALSIMDRAGIEFTDLRTRIAALEGRQEMASNDLLRAHVLARLALDAWASAGLGDAAWRELQVVLHDRFASLVQEAYRAVNQWLESQHVPARSDLRPLIRRSADTGVGGALPPASAQRGRSAMPTDSPDSSMDSHRGLAAPGRAPRMRARPGVGEETRMQTRSAALPRSDHADAVLDRLNRLVGRQLPGFAGTRHGAPPAATPTSASPALSRAIHQAEASLRQRLAPTPGAAVHAPSTPQLLDELQQRKQALKDAAQTPVERATIEIVALLFQSILTEDRIPASVRVWFARLQMPVLRVAVGEPDFFATVDHPARRLIDRMGACVMGFDASSRAVGDALEREIKRVVQVVEAYPDTGRRVFQTVLTEFEKFLEHYFRNENEASRKGVSLAQQVEQRETLAIQYTIELRKMLEGVPVQEGVRQFLFHVWADVLALSALKSGGQGELTRQMKRAAADLIWSASAKVTREERAEVIRKLPLLLKLLRDGMASAGMPADKQEEQLAALNNSLAAAFTAKAAVIPPQRFEELMERLETLEELLPEAADVEIDESIVLDLSGHESSDLEVVSEGGSMPTQAMLAWARELQVGSWFMLDLRGRNDPVQLAWQGLKRQLSLFVSPEGRCVLFQQQRLAAFLQAGLLVPAQDEALTVRATRSALEKLDVDPARLLA